MTDKRKSKAGKDDEPVVIQIKPGSAKDIGGGEATNGITAKWN
jgi:hypothetical protein